MSNTKASARPAATGPPAALLGTAIGLALLALVALGAPRADAAALSGGDTTLALKKGVAKALSDAGVAVKPLKPATAGKKGIAFPITGGQLDTATLTGKVRHSGGLRLEAGGDRLDLEDFTIKLGKKPSLSARVGGDRVKILNLDLSKAKLGREGLAFRAARVKAALAGTAAKAINATFGAQVVAGGLVIGNATVVAETVEVRVLAEGDTQLTWSRARRRCSWSRHQRRTGRPATVTSAGALASRSPVGRCRPPARPARSSTAVGSGQR